MALKLHQETIYLAVNLFDRVMSRHPFTPNKLQGLMCTCLLLACKVRVWRSCHHARSYSWLTFVSILSQYEETRCPASDDFAAMSAHKVSRDEILALEGHVLRTLTFDICVPSALRFCERYGLPIFAATRRRAQTWRFMQMGSYCKLQTHFHHLVLLHHGAELAAL